MFSLKKMRVGFTWSSLKKTHDLRYVSCLLYNLKLATTYFPVYGTFWVIIIKKLSETTYKPHDRPTEYPKW